jgi:hypothetical protein
VAAITSSWNSSVTWAKKPSVGSTITTQSPVNPGAGTLIEFDVTAWANTRDTKGLVVRTNTDTIVHLAGSSAAKYQPYLFVTYVVTPAVPSNLSPSGGSVGVTKPDLTFDGPDDMTAFQIQMSTDGSTVAYDSGSVPGSVGYWVQAAGTPTPTAGQTIYFRVAVTNPSGSSLITSCPWASYTYNALADPVITNPPSTTDDGSPPLTWTYTNQTAYWVEFVDQSTGQIIDSTKGWVNDTPTRSWTPSKSIKSPGGLGTYRLRVKDNITPRVGQKTYGEAVVNFSTAFAGATTGVSTIAVNFTDDPIPTITGTRPAGTPDFVELLRDGVRVPVWDADGDPVMRALGTDVFSGTNFSVKDFTAEPRKSHTWQLRCFVGSVGSSTNPATSPQTFFTKSVWLVDPTTDIRVEIVGPEGGDRPVVDQVVTENSIVHVPVSGGLVVEPIRRRLIRTTRAGTIAGTVLDTDEDDFLAWVQGPSNTRFRLIFGKVNWNVIIGDYSPTDTMYGDACGKGRVGVACSWWERLALF